MQNVTVYSTEHLSLLTVTNILQLQVCLYAEIWPPTFNILHVAKLFIINRKI